MLPDVGVASGHRVLNDTVLKLVISGLGDGRAGKVLKPLDANVPGTSGHRGDPPSLRPLNARHGCACLDPSD